VSRRPRRAPTTRKRLADLAKVSEHKIRQAERVQTAAPDLAEQAVVDGQPSPERPRDQAALLHWLREDVRNAHPGAPLDELTGIMADRLQEMADSGDATAMAMLEGEVREHFLNLTRIALALAGGMTAPEPPTIPKQQHVPSFSRSSRRKSA
jgi:hypothetical protein